MKIKERALSLLLSLVMVLTFMPALTFAEGEEPVDADETSIVEEPIVEEPTSEEPVVEDAVENELVKAPETTELEPPANTVEADWWISGYSDGWLYPSTDDSVYIRAWVHNESDIALEYQWLKGSTELTSWTDLTEEDDEDLYAKYQAVERGTYTFAVREKTDTTQNDSADLQVYEYTVQNGFVFGPYYETTAWADSFWTDEIGPTGNLIVPQTVALADGTTRTVTSVECWAPNSSSITIPASVTELYGAGYTEVYDASTDTWNEVVIPGFTIFGTIGSYAQTYAAKNGIIFRDLAAEAVDAAEAARQGTLGSLPGVKASKPKAAKKAITVKWKKLNKKQLKKGVSNIEVWVCSDGAFANGSTIERVVGKKKSSLKIKGLQKGVTYYVKVRAITYSGGAKIVGPWSAVKKIKVKK